MLSQAQAFQWVKGFGGKGYNYGKAITSDGAGNVYVTGVFADTCDFDPGPGTYTLAAGQYKEMFVAKYNSFGALVWVKQYASQGGYTRGNDIACTGGTVYITGIFSGKVDFNSGSGIDTLSPVGSAGPAYEVDGFLLCLDTSGAFISVINIGVPDKFELACGIAVNSSGGACVTDVWGGGQSNSTIIVRSLNGSSPGTICPVTSSDNVSYGGIAIDNTGNRFVSGSFKGKAAFGSNTLTSTSNTYDAFVALFSPSGALIWVKKVGSVFDDYAAQATSDGTNVYITGYYGGTVDFDPGLTSYTLNSVSNDAFLLKLNGNGNFVFANTLNSDPSSASYGYAIEADVQGNIYAAGHFYGSVTMDPASSQTTYTGNPAIYLNKYTSTGSYVWSQIATSSWQIDCYDICEDGFGNLFTTGQYGGQANFDYSSPGSQLFTVNGSIDIFIEKISNPLTIKEFSNRIETIGIFPNPATDILTVRTETPGRLSVIAADGTIVLRQNSCSGGLHSIHLKDVVPGIYVLLYACDESGKTISKRFFKE